MAEVRRAEIGFAGGQVVGVRLDENALEGLRKAVEGGEGWHDLEIEDGTIALDLSRIVFVRVVSPQAIGFTGA